MGLGSASACSWIGCDSESPAPPTSFTCTAATASLHDPTLACADPAFSALVDEIIAAPYADILSVAATHLRDGLDLASLVAADFHAALRILTPSAGGVMHSLLVINSMNLIGARVDPRRRLLAVLWALQNLKGEQSNQTPMPPVDEDALPSNAASSAMLLADALDGADPDAADLGACGMLRHGSRDELVDMLLRYAVRSGAEPHFQIFPSQVFRALDTFGWGCAEPAVRLLARVLTEAAPEAEREAIFQSSRALASDGIVMTGTNRSLAASRALLAASRTLGPEEMRDAFASALADGLSPDALWDCLLAAAAEIVLRGNGGSGLHAFDAVNALRSAAARAKASDVAPLLLLQAASFIPSTRVEGANWTYPPPVNDVDVDDMGEGAAPDDVEELFARAGAGRGSVLDPTLAFDALAWLSEGGDACAMVQRAAELVVDKSEVDAHRYKFPAAVFEEIERCDSYWRPRFLATGLLVVPGSELANWPSLEEATALAEELGV